MTSPDRPTPRHPRTDRLRRLPRTGRLRRLPRTGRLPVPETCRTRPPSRSIDYAIHMTRPTKSARNPFDHLRHAAAPTNGAPATSRPVTLPATSGQGEDHRVAAEPRTRILYPNDHYEFTLQQTSRVFCTTGGSLQNPACSPRPCTIRPTALPWGPHLSLRGITTLERPQDTAAGRYRSSSLPTRGREGKPGIGNGPRVVLKPSPVRIGVGNERNRRALS